MVVDERLVAEVEVEEVVEVLHVLILTNSHIKL
jgi:hypothetical protein